jgi:hypothetical protein
MKPSEVEYLLSNVRDPGQSDPSSLAQKAVLNFSRASSPNKMQILSREDTFDQFPRKKSHLKRIESLAGLDQGPGTTLRLRISSARQQVEEKKESCPGRKKKNEFNHRRAALRR